MRKFAVLACVILTVSLALAVRVDAQEASPDVVVFPQLGHSDRTISVAYSPDGRRLVSGTPPPALMITQATTTPKIPITLI
jgi:hypothetical protein